MGARYFSSGSRGAGGCCGCDGDTPGAPGGVKGGTDAPGADAVAAAAADMTPALDEPRRADSGVALLADDDGGSAPAPASLPPSVFFSSNSRCTSLIKCCVGARSAPMIRVKSRRNTWTIPITSAPVSSARPKKDIGRRRCLAVLCSVCGWAGGSAFRSQRYPREQKRMRDDGTTAFKFD